MNHVNDNPLNTIKIMNEKVSLKGRKGDEMRSYFTESDNILQCNISK